MELLKQSVGDIIDLQYVENLLEKVSEKQRPGSPTDRPSYCQQSVLRSLIKSGARTYRRVQGTVTLKRKLCRL